MESSPKPGEKSLKNGHIQRTSWDLFFFWPEKIGSIPLLAPEISWVAFAPSEPVAPKRLVGIHCSVIEMGTAWDFAHCLTVEVPNSMHPGGEKPAFRSERFCGKQQENRQCSKPRLRLKGEGIDSTGLIWSSPVSIGHDCTSKNGYSFLQGRRWWCPPWCLLTMGRCLYECFTAKRLGGYRFFLDEIGFFQTSMRNPSQEFWGHLGFATIYTTCLDVSHQAVRAAWQRQQNLYGIIDIFQTWTHKFSKVFHFKKCLSPSIQWRVGLSGRDKNNQKHINSFTI